MTTKARSGTKRILRELSGDLSKTIGERKLLSTVLEMVQMVDAKALEQRAGPNPPFRPQMMLTLVTYSYAACLFGSRDIEYAINADAMVRYICARTYPAWQDIRVFRRQNREWVRQCLMGVLRRIWMMRSGQFDLPQPVQVPLNQTELFATNPQPWLAAEFAQQLEATVDGRLDTAALMDGVESD